VLTAVLLALAGACAFAVSTVVQHRTATDSPMVGGSRWLVRLARRPAWLAAQAAGGLGVALHAAALRSGPVALVQPLLASGLVFALALGAWVDRRHPGRPRLGPGQWVAALAVALGLTGFLLAARPAAGAATAPGAGLAVVAVAALLVATVAMVVTRRPGRPHAALVRGVAAGTCFGVTGLLLKQLLGAPLPSWSAAGTAGELVVVALAGIYASQGAFAAGPLVESLPVTTVLEPAIGVLLAEPLFGESLLPGAGARLGQLAGALLLGVGLVVLARRGPAGVDEAVPESFRRRSGELAMVGS
jgi:drug/metabolite transporter (DMT)-like permease